MPRQSAKWHIYSTKRWRALRDRQLKKQPHCEFHLKRQEKVRAQIVDHINPHRGNERLAYDPVNLQSLCKRCHDSVKQSQEKNPNKGCDSLGNPLDPLHHWNKKN